MILFKNKIIKPISLLGVCILGLISIHVSAQSDTGRDNRVYVVVPQMPTFQGDLDNYMGNHLQYPQSAVDRGIQGTVNVTFVVTQTGEIDNVTILSGVSPDLDSEAVRVVRNMPPWNPGVKNGKAVNVQFNLPVYFQLNSLQNQPPAQRQSIYQPMDTVFILRDGLYVDPYIGYGEGGPGSSTTPVINMGSNVKFGVGISYMFPSNIGVSIGLQIQQFKFNYNYSNDSKASMYVGTETEIPSTASDITSTAGYNEAINYTFTYAQIPILCRYISSQEGKPGFYAEAGLIVNYLVSSEISGTATQEEYQLGSTPSPDWYRYNSISSNTVNVSLPSQNPNKLTFTAHAAAGAIIPFNNKISLILAVSPDFGIMNAGDGSKDIVNFGTSKFYLYGNGTYGSFNSYTFDAKLLIKMFGSSQAVRRN